MNESYYKVRIENDRTSNTFTIEDTVWAEDEYHAVALVAVKHATKFDYQAVGEVTVEKVRE